MQNTYIYFHNNLKSVRESNISKILIALKCVFWFLITITCFLFILFLIGLKIMYVFMLFVYKSVCVFVCVIASSNKVMQDT